MTPSYHFYRKTHHLIQFREFWAKSPFVPGHLGQNGGLGATTTMTARRQSPLRTTTSSSLFEETDLCKGQMTKTGSLASTMPPSRSPRLCSTHRQSLYPLRFLQAFRPVYHQQPLRIGARRATKRCTRCLFLYIPKVTRKACFRLESLL